MTADYSNIFENAISAFWIIKAIKFINNKAFNYISMDDSELLMRLVSKKEKISHLLTAYEEKNNRLVEVLLNEILTEIARDKSVHFLESSNQSVN